MRPALRGPIHAAYDATERKSALRVATCQLLKDLQHSIRIKLTVSNVGLGVCAKLQLSGLLRGNRIDTGRSQTLARVQHADSG